MYGGISCRNNLTPFFENEYGQAVAVTAERYKDMVETFLTPCL